MAIVSTEFWLDLAEIIWINILLSGDNAVVIALAARKLAPTQQRTAIVWGSVLAIVFRVVLTLLAARLLMLPWLKAVGGLLLLYIGVRLLAPEKPSTAKADSAGGIWGAIRTIVVADLIMSLDNVVAVAAAAHGSFVLLVTGLVLSIPLVVFGSTLLLKVVERAPVIVWAGAALLGFIAGDMLVADPALLNAVNHVSHFLHVSHSAVTMTAGAVGALFVMAAGKTWQIRTRT